jgi:protoporphyrinogen oxidase
LATTAEPIIIVGAGLSGLAAALELEAAGEASLILESATHVGGKLETTFFKEAYRLDRGFQVLLPAYPELQRIENLEKDLELKYFKSGARLEMEKSPILMANPLLHPSQFLATAFGSYASFSDKLLVLKLQLDVQRGDPDALLNSSTLSTLEYLRAYGFSEKIISTFWGPFFSGIFLESELATAAGFFRYLVRMFASSPVAVPKLGVGEWPKLLERRLKKSEVRLGTQVKKITDQGVELSDGQKIKARAVISATMGQTNPEDTGPFGHVTSFWFASPEPPFEGAWLSLNSRSSKRLINHVAVLSNVSPDYALKGDALICVSVIKERAEIDLELLLSEAQALYGPSTQSWVLLRADEIKRAFPLYLNRTDLNTPSQQGALARGRRVAREYLNSL